MISNHGGFSMNNQQFFTTSSYPRRRGAIGSDMYLLHHAVTCRVKGGSRASDLSSSSLLSGKSVSGELPRWHAGRSVVGGLSGAAPRSATSSSQAAGGAAPAMWGGDWLAAAVAAAAGCGGHGGEVVGRGAESLGWQEPTGVDLCWTSRLRTVMTVSAVIGVS